MEEFDQREQSGLPPRRSVTAGRHLLLVALLVTLAGCTQPVVVTVRTESTIGAPTVTMVGSPTVTTAPTSSPAPTVQSTPTGQPEPAGKAAAAVAAVEHWADDHSGTAIGAAVLDRDTGEFALGRKATQPMYSASLAKLIVAVDVLQGARAGRPLADRDRRLIARSLGPSDDEAMNALWTGFDGLGAVSRIAARLGLENTKPPANKARWGETLTSARDVVRLFDLVLTGMPAQDRDFILNSLAEAPSRAVDGFELSFGLAKTGSAAVKSGWMCCQQGKLTLHSAGVMDRHAPRFVVALLSSQPRSLGYAKARDELTDAASPALR